MIETDIVTKIEHDLIEQRKLYLSDEIGNYDGSSFCAAIDWLIGKSRDPIHVYITSQGGSVFPMLGMYDTLELVKNRSGIEVVTVVLGYAASAAAVLLQAGTRRLATRHSRVLLHEVSQFYYGQERVSDAEEAAREMVKVNDMLFQIVADRSGHTRDQLKALTHKRDVWFDANEALAFGLIDEIVQ